MRPLRLTFLLSLILFHLFYLSYLLIIFLSLSFVCRLAHQQTRAQISDLLFENADKNHDGEIDFKEFHKFASSKADQLRAVFDSIDTNQDGRLDKQEVKGAREGRERGEGGD